MSVKLRAAGLVAAVYGCFLIFAQFAFVELIRVNGIGTGGEKLALGLMAVAGAAAGVLVAAQGCTVGRLRLAFGLCASAAALAPWQHGLAGIIAVAGITGLGLGAATVSVATLLPRWCGVAWVAVGTGLGYAICNLPWVFLATPSGQAWVGAAFGVAGVLLVPGGAAAASPSSGERVGTWSAILAFLALVWLDSAAFFIIQHEGELKSATWGSGMLWRNAGLHLIAALAAIFWLRSGRWRGLLIVAWAILAVAALAVNGTTTRSLAGWWYPVGVSLYSTVLVAWPGFLSGPGDERRVAWRAAGLFAIAGWFGSANGIGMAETLHRVPTLFVMISGAVVLVAAIGFRRWPALAGIGGVALAAVGFPKAEPDPATRGRQVYLAEGCIACHSRYVRAEDPEGWGPPSVVDDVLAERPVLIGNRRQGPDLAHVGARRSAAWLREHFIAPRKFVKHSPMPSYAHLFEDERGEALVAWLTDGQGEALGWRMERAAAWKPEGDATGDGAGLFAAHCAVCHGPAGRGDGELAHRFAKPPANLVAGPFVWTSDPSALPRVIKWGLPGTDMPGHELLDDGEVLALAEWVLQIRK